MFYFKHKLSESLRNCLDDNYYKDYRIIIECKSLLNKTERKIKSYKGTILRVISSANCICANVSSNIIDRLLELPQVKYIDFDIYALLCANNVLSSNHISHHNQYPFTGKDICIGIIDSGIYPHSDLLHPNNKIKKFTDLISDLQYPYDDNGHGTFMSGIICGSGYKSKGMYKGIAENSKIYMIKCFNSCGKGFVSDILFALEMLINESFDLNIKVICLPFELIGYNKFILYLFSKLFNLATLKNITIVVPSGHNGNTKGSIKGIASLDNCITVGGLNTLSLIKPYVCSSSGPCNTNNKPTLAAACVDICSLNCDINYISERNNMKLYPHNLKQQYTNYTGTSCAAAYVSGVCSLLYEKKPTLNYNDIVSLLKLSCTLLNVSKWIQGSGMIDINKLFDINI